MMIIELNIFQTTALAMLLYCLGKFIVKKVEVLQKICIPAPVVGGLIFAILHFALYSAGVVSFEFTETLKDVFMVLFFTSIGYTACFSLLKKGGAKVLVFLMLAIAVVVLQNVLGVGLATLFDLDPRLGLAMGSIPMVGGHGTSASFGPYLEQLGVSGAQAVAVATATFGLISGSLLGGPIARYKIKKYNLSSQSQATPVESAEVEDIYNSAAKASNTDAFTIAAVLLIVAAGIGTYITSFFVSINITLPVYFGGMVVAAVVRNTCDTLKIQLPTTALDTWGNVSLTIFLSIALMTLKLWQLVELAVPMIIILIGQILLMLVFANFAVFNFMGKNYESAVMTSAFCGFGMGATPNAMANMQAITQKHGPAPTAFFVVPIVGSMFIDFFNTAIILFFINLL